MSNAYYHAVSSAKKYGGVPKDYLELHMAFDESRNHCCDKRHRMLYHHSAGIEAMVKRFGPTIKNSWGREVPTRDLGEQHITEDLGFVPSFQDWVDCLDAPRWGNPRTKLLFSKFEPTGATHE
jgi:hypothetical protein